MWYICVCKQILVMGNIITAIETLNGVIKERGWDKTFWAFDIHHTIIKPNYSSDEIPTEVYDYAIECLQILSNDPSICMILYTCSHPREVQEYLEFFRSKGVNFEYVNENPEVRTDLGGYGCYDKKPYFNVLFEDKAGFDANNDWKVLYEYLININKEEKELV
jgi:hypothetical protein